MLTVRHAADRGHTDLGWLDSRHTFSFGSYADPAHMGFRSLRVLNEDRVAPATGFGAHGHRDMEVLSYVFEGTLAHKDSMASEARMIRPNEVQAMSAGSGVIHSEFNPSPTEPVHFLQIWILPSQEDVPPSYQHVACPASEKRGVLRLIAGPDKNAKPPAVFLHQDARIYATVLGEGESLDYSLVPGRKAWVQCAVGQVDVNGVTLNAGDGLAATDETALTLRGAGDAANELLLFDLA